MKSTLVTRALSPRIAFTAASLALFAVACGGAPIDGESTNVDVAPAASAVEPKALCQIERLQEMVPGVDDFETFASRCGGGGGGGSTPAPKPLPPPAPTCGGRGPTADSDEFPRSFVCNWSHSGVSSKDGGWLQDRERAGCLQDFARQITAYKSANKTASVSCGDVSAFSVDGTDTHKDSWTGKRSWKAHGTMTFQVIVDRFGVCRASDAPAWCSDGFPMYASTASSGD